MNDLTAIRAQMEALEGFIPGPWYTHNQPGDWGLGGAHSIHVADANPYEWDQCIAHVEYQTPYCLGEKPSVIEAARTAACNARLIAGAPDMHATILALCDAMDELRADNERLKRLLDLRGVGPAERYWEGRWRDEASDNERLRADRDQGAKDYCTLMDQRDALAVHVKKLEFALRPFVEYVHDDFRRGKATYELVATDRAGGGLIGAEDLRRARAALAQKGGEA